MVAFQTRKSNERSDSSCCDTSVQNRHLGKTNLSAQVHVASLHVDIMLLWGAHTSPAVPVALAACHQLVAKPLICLQPLCLELFRRVAL
jgi:hypothetical protein